MCVFIAVLAMAMLGPRTVTIVIAMALAATFVPALIPSWDAGVNVDMGVTILLVSMAMWAFFGLVQANLRAQHGAQRGRPARRRGRAQPHRPRPPRPPRALADDDHDQGRAGPPAVGHRPRAGGGRDHRGRGHRPALARRRARRGVRLPRGLARRRAGHGGRGAAGGRHRGVAPALGRARRRAAPGAVRLGRARGRHQRGAPRPGDDVHDHRRRRTGSRSPTTARSTTAAAGNGLTGLGERVAAVGGRRAGRAVGAAATAPAGGCGWRWPARRDAAAARRRRPGARALGARRAAVAGARLHRRRRGRAGATRSSPRRSQSQPGRRPARHRDARRRRARRRRRAARRRAVVPRARPDDVRPPRLPAPGDGGRRPRLRRQGRPGRAARRRRAAGRAPASGSSTRTSPRRRSPTGRRR